MAISSVDATGTAATAGARTRLADNFDTFLTLLTTQMKNQDPLSPMDSTQFTQQMVQMTGVEQQLLTNDLLKQMVSNTSSGISAAVSLIGKDVKAVSDTAGLSGGSARWEYKLNDAAEKVKVEVVDAQGKTVHSSTLSGDNAKAGDHAFAWDGKNLAGQKLPDGGTYTLRLTALDSSGANVASTTYVHGIVSGVQQADGQTLITVNGGKIGWDKITSITQPPATTTTDTIPSTSEGVS